MASEPGSRRSRFALLGPVELFDGTRPVPLGGPRQVGLLAYLLLRANRVVAREELVEAIWGTEASDAAVNRLHVAVTRLRKALEAAGAALDAAGGGYRIRVAVGELDVDAFERLVGEARRALASSHYAQAARDARAAVALWRGPALAQLRHEASAQDDIRHLEELRLIALETRFEAELEIGDFTVLIGELQTVVTRFPTRERLTGQLMRALYRCGRQAEALAAFQHVRWHLDSELGLVPGPELEGLQRAILLQTPAVDAAPLVVPVPTALAAASRQPFAGRVDALQCLTTAFDRARSGMLSVALVTGEAGIGKTRLAAELARHASDEGALVLYGCGSATCEPIADALGAYAETAAETTLRDECGSAASVLADLVPAVRRRFPGLPDAPRRDPDSDRRRRLDAIAAWVTALSGSRPVVLVLDDLDRADPSTLLLLRYLVRPVATGRLLILAIAQAGIALASLTAELDRTGRLTRVPLLGMSEADIGALLEGHPPTTVRPTFIRSGGNPLFAQELASQGGLPARIAQLVNDRVQRLSAAAAELLAYAALFGSGCDLRVMGRAARLGGAALVDAADELVATGLLLDGGRPEAGCVFRHELVREAVVASLTTTRRAHLRGRVAAVLTPVHAEADAREERPAAPRSGRRSREPEPFALALALARGASDDQLHAFIGDRPATASRPA